MSVHWSAALGSRVTSTVWQLMSASLISLIALRSKWTGLWIEIRWQDAFIACRRSWVPSPAPQKWGVCYMPIILHSRDGGRRIRNSKAPSPSCTFKNSWEHMESISKNKMKTKKDHENTNKAHFGYVCVDIPKRKTEEVECRWCHPTGWSYKLNEKEKGESLLTARTPSWLPSKLRWK